MLEVFQQSFALGLCNLYVPYVLCYTCDVSLDLV